MHRTTIILDPFLEKKLRQKAQQEGQTLTNLIQDFIRRGFSHETKKKIPKKIKLQSFSMGEMLVDPADRSRLWDLMDES